MHAHLPKNSNIYGWPLAQCISWDGYHINTNTTTDKNKDYRISGCRPLVDSGCAIVYRLKLLQSEHPAPALVSNLIPLFPNPCLQLTVLLFTVKIKIFPYGNWKVNAKLVKLAYDFDYWWWNNTTVFVILTQKMSLQHLWLSLTVMCMYKYLDPHISMPVNGSYAGHYS